ncbi:MAG: hypothetical protein JWQ40_4624, partial [Segetibacter sp.]|nr:hypothetical protein [Segetibacter sp.]
DKMVKLTKRPSINESLLKIPLKQPGTKLKDKEAKGKGYFPLFSTGISPFFQSLISVYHSNDDFIKSGICETLKIKTAKTGLLVGLWHKISCWLLPKTRSKKNI